MGLTSEDLRTLEKIVQGGLGEAATCLLFAALGALTCAIVTMFAEG